MMVVGSCSGLICLTDDSHHHTDNIVLWNPSIRKFMQLPPPQINNYGGNGTCIYGLGFDASVCDPRVVRIVTSGIGLEERDLRAMLNTRNIVHKLSDAELTIPQYEIYTHSRGTWGGAKYFNLPCVLHNGKLAAPYVNGAVHWGAFGSNDGKSCIVAFHVGKDAFTHLELPDSVASKTVTMFSLLKRGENQLVVAEYDKSFDCESCCIWIMDKYDKWNKLYNIDMKLGRLRRVVGFKSNGVVLIAAAWELVSYRPGLNNEACIRHGILGVDYSFFVDYYQESLALVKDQLVNLKNGICLLG